MKIYNRLPFEYGIFFDSVYLRATRLGGWYILPALGFTRFSFKFQLELAWLCWQLTVNFPHRGKEDI